MKHFLMSSRAYFDKPDDGGGGGDQGGQQQQNQGGQQQQQTDGQSSAGGSLAGEKGGQSQGQQQGGAAPYRPEGLPDHLFGKDEKDTIDRLLGAYKGARGSLGERGALPDKPDGYRLEASEKLKPYVENFDKDPVFAATREIFHKAGITDKQFNAVVGPWLEKLIDGGLVDAPVDVQAQLMSLAPASAATLDDAGKKAEATKRINANLAWVDTAKLQGTFPTVDDGRGGKASPVADFFAAALASDPRAHAAIEWLRGGSEQTRPAMPGGQAPAGVTQEGLAARINDPRNDPRSQKFDRTFAEETDRLTRQMHPG